MRARRGWGFKSGDGKLLSISLPALTSQGYVRVRFHMAIG
jgi:hypothetical protein